MAAAGEPVFISDIDRVIDASSERPIVRCLATGTQSIPDVTLTAVQFGAEDWDLPGGMHDPVTNNTRITPIVAGYYRFHGTLYMGPRTDYANVDVSFRKNGATSVPPADRRSFSTAATQVSMALSVQCTAQIFCNGTTDYVEMMAFQDNAANVAMTTNQSARFSSCFEAEFLRY
jgi:hypothetical protein